MVRPFSLSKPATMAAEDSVTVRCAVEYDGTAFFGFQVQPQLRTVGGTIESVLSRIFDERIALAAAGRTDSGVHASGQVMSFRTSRTDFPFERLAIAANSALPHDVSLRETSIVAPDFSARFNARSRTYVYLIYRCKDRSALLVHRAYHVHRDLDLEPMREAAASLVGTHDFRSFCATLPGNGNTVRTVTALQLQESGDVLRICVTADGFLHRMVRTIAGTLVECGLGRRAASSVTQVLASRARDAAGMTAPAHGLYLAGVQYDDGYNSFREPLLV